MDELTAKRIIITGGSGFIGANLVEYYLERGWQVLNLDIAPPRNPAHHKEWRPVDLLDRALLIETVRRFSPDVLLHFAARTDLDENRNLEGYAANIDGVCNIIEAIRAAPAIQRAVFASSQLVCRLGYQPKDDYDYCPTTLYGRSKALSERILRAAADFGPAWAIVRPTSLWGPWFDVPYKNFFNMIRRGLYVHPGGIMTLKQWGFIGNAVHQVARLVEAPSELIHKRTFYLADYEPTELRRFADLVQQALGARPIVTVPYKALQAAALLGDFLQSLGWRNPPLTRFRLGNIVTTEMQNLEPLHRVVGNLPFTLEQGIQITAEWLKEQTKSDGG